MPCSVLLCSVWELGPPPAREHMPEAGAVSPSLHGSSRNERRIARIVKPTAGAKPYDGLLPILNAGSSPQGRDFAARNSNVRVVGGPKDRAEVVETVRANARRTYERRVGVFTPTYCVCRRSRAEALEFYCWYAEEHADWDAVDNLMTLQGLHAQVADGVRQRHDHGRPQLPGHLVPTDLSGIWPGRRGSQQDRCGAGVTAVE